MATVNKLELNAAMARKDTSATEMAQVIRRSRVTFDKKRIGEVPFLDHEILAMSNALELTLEDVDTVFFGGHLRNRNIAPASTP